MKMHFSGHLRFGIGHDILVSVRFTGVPGAGHGIPIGAINIFKDFGMQWRFCVTTCSGTISYLIRRMRLDVSVRKKGHLSAYGLSL